MSRLEQVIDELKYGSKASDNSLRLEQTIARLKMKSGPSVSTSAAKPRISYNGGERTVYEGAQKAPSSAVERIANVPVGEYATGRKYESGLTDGMANAFLDRYDYETAKANRSKIQAEAVEDFIEQNSERGGVRGFFDKLTSKKVLDRRLKASAEKMTYKDVISKSIEQDEGLHMAEYLMSAADELTGQYFRANARGEANADAILAQANEYRDLAKSLRKNASVSGIEQAMLRLSGGAKRTVGSVGYGLGTVGQAGKDYEATMDAIGDIVNKRNELMELRYAEAASGASLERIAALDAEIEELTKAIDENRVNTVYEGGVSAELIESGEKDLAAGLLGTSATTKAVSNILQSVAPSAAMQLVSLGLTVATGGAAAPVASALSLGGMGLMSAGSRAYELKDFGALEAASRGALSGTIEALTEKVPLDNLLGFLKSDNLLASYIKQILSEGGEETISYFANYLADLAAQDPNAEFSLAEALESFVGGAAGGALMGGFGVAANAVQNVQIPDLRTLVRNATKTAPNSSFEAEATPVTTQTENEQIEPKYSSSELILFTEATKYKSLEAFQAAMEPRVLAGELSDAQVRSAYVAAQEAIRAAETSVTDAAKDLVAEYGGSPNMDAIDSFAEEYYKDLELMGIDSRGALETFLENIEKERMESVLSEDTDTSDLVGLALRYKTYTQFRRYAADYIKAFGIKTDAEARRFYEMVHTGTVVQPANFEVDINTVANYTKIAEIAGIPSKKAGEIANAAYNVYREGGNGYLELVNQIAEIINADDVEVEDGYQGEVGSVRPEGAEQSEAERDRASAGDNGADAGRPVEPREAQMENPDAEGVEEVSPGRVRSGGEGVQQRVGDGDRRGEPESGDLGSAADISVGSNRRKHSSNKARGKAADNKGKRLRDDGVLFSMEQQGTGRHSDGGKGATGEVAPEPSPENASQGLDGVAFHASIQNDPLGDIDINKADGFGFHIGSADTAINRMFANGPKSGHIERYNVNIKKSLDIDEDVGAFNAKAVISKLENSEDPAVRDLAKEALQEIGLTYRILDVEKYSELLEEDEALKQDDLNARKKLAEGLVELGYDAIRYPNDVESSNGNEYSYAIINPAALTVADSISLADALYEVVANVSASKKYRLSGAWIQWAANRLEKYWNGKADINGNPINGEPRDISHDEFRIGGDRASAWEYITYLASKERTATAKKAQEAGVSQVGYTEAKRDAILTSAKTKAALYDTGLGKLLELSDGDDISEDKFDALTGLDEKLPKLIDKCWDFIGRSFHKHDAASPEPDDLASAILTALADGEYTAANMFNDLIELMSGEESSAGKVKNEGKSIEEIDDMLAEARALYEKGIATYESITKEKLEPKMSGKDIDEIISSEGVAEYYNGILPDDIDIPITYPSKFKNYKTKKPAAEKAPEEPKIEELEKPVEEENLSASIKRGRAFAELNMQRAAERDKRVASVGNFTSFPDELNNPDTAKKWFIEQLKSAGILHYALESLYTEDIIDSKVQMLPKVIAKKDFDRLKKFVEDAITKASFWSSDGKYDPEGFAEREGKLWDARIDSAKKAAGSAEEAHKKAEAEYKEAVESKSGTVAEKKSAVDKAKKDLDSAVDALVELNKEYEKWKNYRDDMLAADRAKYDAIMAIDAAADEELSEGQAPEPVQQIEELDSKIDANERGSVGANTSHEARVESARQILVSAVEHGADISERAITNLMRATRRLTQYEVELTEFAERNLSAETIEGIVDYFSTELAKARAESASIANDVKLEETARALRALKRAKRNVETKKQRVRVNRSVDKLINLALNPKEFSYIPKEVVSSVADLLMSVDTASYHRDVLNNSVRSTSAKQQKRDKAIKQIESLGSEESLDDFDKDVKELAVQLSAAINKIKENATGPVVKMSAEQIRRIADDMDSILFYIRHYNEVKSIDYKGGIKATSDAVVEQTKSQKGSEVLNEIENEAALTGENFLRKIGGWDKNSVMYKFADVLVQAVNNRSRDRMNLRKDMDRLASDYPAYRRFVSTRDNDTVNVGLKDKNGKSIKLTHAEMVQLVLTWRDPDGRRHIDTGRQGQGFSLYRDDKKVRVSSFTESHYNNILKKLSEYDKEWIKAARNLFDKNQPKLINSVSQALFHKDIAVKKNYFRLTVDQAYRGDNGGVGPASLLYSGILQHRNDGSTLPLIISGVPYVMNDVIEVSADVANIALPLRDMRRVLNVKGVWAAIEDAYGENGVNRIKATLDSLEYYGHKDSAPYMQKAIGDITANASEAALGYNIPLNISQLSTYLTAIKHMHPASVAKGLKSLFLNKEAAESLDAEVDSYTGLLYDRRKGLSVPEFARADETNTLGKRIAKKLGTSDKENKVAQFAERFSPTVGITEMDTRAARAMWVAAKAEAKRLGFEGEDLFTETTRIYEATMNETQATSDPLFKTALAKSRTPFARAITLFTGQTAKMSSMLHRAIGEYNAASDAKSKAEAGKNLARTIASVSADVVVNAFIRSVLRGLLKRKKGEEIAEDIVVEMGSSAAGIILPGIGDLVYDAILNAAGYDTFMSLGTIASDSIIDVFDAFSKFKSADSADDYMEAALGVLKNSAALIGLPARNIDNLVDGVGSYMRSALDKLGIVDESKTLITPSIDEALGMAAQPVNIPSLFDDYTSAGNKVERQVALDELGDALRDKNGKIKTDKVYDTVYEVYTTEGYDAYMDARDAARALYIDEGLDPLNIDETIDSRIAKDLGVLDNKKSSKKEKEEAKQRLIPVLGEDFELDEELALYGVSFKERKFFTRNLQGKVDVEAYADLCDIINLAEEKKTWQVHGVKKGTYLMGLVDTWLRSHGRSLSATQIRELYGLFGVTESYYE